MSSRYMSRAALGAPGGRRTLKDRTDTASGISVGTCVRSSSLNIWKKRTMVTGHSEMTRKELRPLSSALVPSGCVRIE